MKKQDDPQIIANKLSNFIALADRKNLLIGGDINSQSVRWGAETANNRGEFMEDFIALHGLTILNTPNQSPTFCTTRAKSYIDVTLAKGQIITRLNNWRVLENKTSCDHNLITFSLTSLENTRTRDVNNPIRYNTRRINIRNLHVAIRVSSQHLSSLPTSTVDDILCG